MNLTRACLLPALALTLSGCAVAIDPSFKLTAPPSGDSKCSPRDEYRTGYDIGSRDVSYGYPNDPRRAYGRFGHGLESPFQDGYADGYARRPSRF